MVVLKVTPVRNVQIEKRCFRSDRLDMFFSKIVAEGSRVDVFDVTDRKQKALPVNELNSKKHRMIINDRKFYICSVTKAVR